MRGLSVEDRRRLMWRIFAGIKAENMLLDKRQPPNVKLSSVGYYKATLDTVPKSRVGSFGFVGTAPFIRFCNKHTLPRHGLSICIITWASR